MSRIGIGMAAAAATLVALLSGCHTCEDHEGSAVSFELAEFNYRNGKYDQAKTLYSRCVEKCPANEDGWIGLANSAREIGNSQYQAAADIPTWSALPSDPNAAWSPPARSSASPTADSSRSPSRPSSRPAATAAPTTPHTEVGCHPRRRISGWLAAATAPIASNPAT